MRALVRTVDGVFEVDLDEELVLGLVDAPVEPERVEVSLPLVVAAARSGSTVIAIFDRRPPLAISNDAGRTWSTSGNDADRNRESAAVRARSVEGRQRTWLSYYHWWATSINYPRLAPAPSWPM